jgi:WD40 repeat protein
MIMHSILGKKPFILLYVAFLFLSAFSCYKFGNLGEKEKESMEAKSELLSSNFLIKKDTLLSYYETLNLAFKAQSLDEKNYQTKMSIARTLFQYVYDPYNSKIKAGENSHPLSFMKEKLILQGHHHFIKSISISPDRKLLASGSSDRSIKIWDITDYKEIRTIIDELHNEVVVVSFSADGKILASGTKGGRVRIWDYNTGKQLHLFESPFSPILGSLSISPDGKILAISYDDGAVIFNLETKKEIKRLDLKGSAKSVKFSPNGKYLAISDFLSIHILNLDTYTELSVGKEVRGTVASMDFSPDSNVLISGHTFYIDHLPHGKLHAWDIRTGMHIKEWEGQGEILSVVFSPDGKSIASSSSDKSIKIWDYETGLEIRTLLGHEGAVTSIVFTLDGKQIISASLDSTIRIWGISEENKIPTLDGVSCEPVRFLNDGKSILCAKNNVIYRYDINSHKEIQKYLSHRDSFTHIRDFKISSDYKLMVTGAMDNYAKIWDIDSGNVLHDLKHSDGVTGVDISRNGKYVATFSSGYLNIWDTATGNILKVIRVSKYGGATRNLSFSPDGKHVAVSGIAEELKIYEWESGKEIKIFKNQYDYISSPQYHPNGKILLAKTREGVVPLWDVEKGEVTNVIPAKGDFIHVSNAEFSPSGNLIALISHNEVQLHSMKRPVEIKKLISLSGWYNPLDFLNFSPDGYSIASTTTGSMKIWPFQLDKNIKLACKDLQNQINYWISLGEFSPIPLEELQKTKEKCDRI